MQGLMNSGLKVVHAIEQDSKQSGATMAHLRTYKPSFQLGKIVPSSRVRGHTEPEEEVLKEEKTVDVKCGKCDKDTQFPPARQCHSCGAYVCVPCTPRIDAKECPVCEGISRCRCRTSRLISLTQFPSLRVRRCLTIPFFTPCARWISPMYDNIWT